MHKNTKELSRQRFFDGDCSLNRGLPIDLFCHVQKNHTRCLSAVISPNAAAVKPTKRNNGK